MRRGALLPLLAAAALAAGGSAPAAADAAAAEQPALPALTGRVMDEAKLIPPAAEAEIAATLAALEPETTDQLMVVTVPDLEGEPVEALGLRLGNGWGIGGKGIDNGTLLIVAPQERRVRIEIGYGLEGLFTDARAKSIIKERLIPLLEKGSFEQAIRTGVHEIASVLRFDTKRLQRKQGA